jgi:hypothetical protein
VLAPLSQALLVLATLLTFAVTPWAGIPIAVFAVLNEVVRFLLMYGTTEDEE